MGYEILKEVGWGSLGGAILTLCIWFFPFGLKESFKAALQKSLQKDVESHKNALDQLTERLKHDMHKEMISAEVVITERHKIYAGLYKLFLIAKGKVGNLNGFSRSLTFEEYGVDDFERHLKERKLPLQKLNELVEQFRRKKEDGVKEWKKYEKVLEIQEARRDIQNAQNYWLEKELYLTDKVSKGVQLLVGDLKERLTRIECPDPTNKNEIRENSEVDRKIREGLDKLKEIMRSELQKGTSN